MSKGLNLLHEAIEQNDSRLTQALVDSGCDVNLLIRNETACTLAITIGCDIQIVETIASSTQFMEGAKNSDGKTPLYMAAKNGYFDAVKLLVSRGCNINLLSVKDETPLMAAVKCDLNVVKYLCENGADVNKKSCSGETALYKACCAGNITVVKWLLKYGADVNIQTNNAHHTTGHTPLMAALPSSYSIQYRNKRKSDALNIVRLLISNGCDVNARFWNGNTALQIAEENMDVYTVCILAECGTNIHIRNKFGITAFEDAIQPNKQIYDVAYALLLYGYDIDEVSSPEHPLITILRGYNHSETRYFPYNVKMRDQLLVLVNELVTKKQDLIDKIKELITSFPDSTKTHVQSFMKLAENQKPPSLRWSCRKVIRRLIKSNMFNALWNLPIPNSLKQYLSLSENTNQNPVKLHELLLAIKESNDEKVTMLINNSVDINYSFGKHTPLTEAIQSSSLDVCKLLIRHGATINQCDNTGRAPLHWAVSRNGQKITEDIRHIKLNDKLNRKYGLIIAAAHVLIPCMMYLLENGCDPDTVDEKGRSALHYAACRGALEPTAALLAAGISLNSRDCHGNTPLHDVVSNCNSFMTSILSSRDQPARVKYNHCLVGKMLIDSGADLSVMNEAKTPLDMARQNGCEKCIEILTWDGPYKFEPDFQNYLRDSMHVDIKRASDITSRDDVYSLRIL